MITPGNLKRHEFIGLNVRVAEAPNPSLIGIKGTVVDETRNLLIIKDEKKERKIPKEKTEIEIEVGNEKIVIKGKEIIGRPEDRIKRTRK